MKLASILVLALASACESGWDVSGQVETANAPDRSRALYVYVVDAETIDLAAVKAGDSPTGYLQVEAAPVIPADALPFGLHEFGCHHGSVAVVAWAPSAAPVPQPNGNTPFNPVAGDHVVVSDVRHPYCGTGVHPERVTLVLDGGGLQ